MEKVVGLVRVRVQKGKNLAVRDTLSSDPYVCLAMDQQKLRTRGAKNSCNPEWNDELTLSIMDHNSLINLIVHDKDTITVDGEMDDACADIYKTTYELLEDGIETTPKWHDSS